MPKKILIVDDEPSIRITLKTVLKTKGYDVSDAENADKAWDKIIIKKPDLILLDIMMPGMKPVDFIKRIRDNSMLKDIKIIFVTAVTGTKETAQEADVETTIEKPFTNEQLLSAVKKAIG